MFMDVHSGGQVPPTKWGWRYLAWAGVPLLAGVLLARYAGPAAPEAGARATATATTMAEATWAQHLASPLGLFLLQLLVLLLVAKGAGALLKRLGQPAVIGEMAAGLMMGPLVLGSLLPQLHGALFPASSLGPLGMLSQLG
ncbi:sodium:proton symporter, partial [Stenotrophomonas maltophilia]|nr:sodium:proton symporter [Stenotrophomonas maltophilia]